MPDSMPVVDFLTRVTDDNGDPVSGGSIEFYDAGTNTPKEVFANAALSSSLGTSVDLDSAGYPVSSGTTRTLIYTGTDDYKVIVKDADGATLITHDNVPGAVATPAASAVALPSTPVLTKTTAYTITTDDRGKVVNCVTTSAGFTVTLPSAVTAGDGWRVCVRNDGTANTATIATVSSQTMSFRGSASTTIELTQRGESVWLVSNGSNWLVDADSVTYNGARDDVFLSEFTGATNTAKLEAAATYANANGLWVDLEGQTITLTSSGAVAPRKLRNGTINATAVTNGRIMNETSSTIPVGLYVTGGEMMGAAYAYATVSGAIAAGAVSITVDSTASFAIGDEILIHKATQWGNDSNSGYFSEAATILEITSGTVLRVAGGVKQAYSASAPATTIRKFPAVDLYWKDITILGSQTNDGMIGAMITHARFALLERVNVEGCRRAGMAIHGCREVRVTGSNIERCDQGGYGYGIVHNGTDTMLVADSTFRRCREAIASGGNFGPGKLLSSTQQVSGCSMHGCADAAVNAHPGVMETIVTNVTSHMDPTAQDEYGSGLISDGDAILLSSTRAIVTGCNLSGQRRGGVVWQPVTPGDTSNELVLVAANNVIQSTSANANGWAISATMSSASSAATCSHIDASNNTSDCSNGIAVDFYNTAIDKVTMDNNRVRARGTTGASTLQAGVLSIRTSNASATNKPDSISITGGRYDHNTTTAEYAAIYIQGLSSAVIPHVSVSGVRTYSGNIGLYVGQVTACDRWSHRSTGHVTASTAGTGATINSTHST